MRAAKILAAEQIAAVALVAAGDVFAQSGPKGFPNPRPVIGLVIFYGLLGWVSSLGMQAARISAGIGSLVLLLLAMSKSGLLVENEAGTALTGFLQTQAGSIPVAPSEASAIQNANAQGIVPKVGGRQLPGGAFIAGIAARIARGFGIGGPNASAGPSGAPITGSLRSRGVPRNPDTGQPTPLT